MNDEQRRSKEWNEPIGIPRSQIPPPLPEVDDDLDEDYGPMQKPISLRSVAESVLRHPARTIYELHHGNAKQLVRRQLWLAVICFAAYGVTVGTFTFDHQLWAAPLKIIAGVFFSALICIPSLFVFSCLSGADSEPSQIVGALAGVLTIGSLLLLAFGPVSWIFSQSTESIVFMGFLHLTFWGIALYYGLQYLKRSVTLLNGRGSVHLAIWAGIFILVTLQMSTTLRPIVGSSENFVQVEKKFFLTHWGEQMTKRR